MIDTVKIINAVQPIIDRIKDESFVDEHDATNIEAFALLMSKYFQWTGRDISEAAIQALEDANYHRLSLEFQKAHIEEFK